MSEAVPLVLAGHGTRDLVGVRAVHDLLERVRALLPGVRVEAGFVELTPPTVEEVLAQVLADHDAAVVVPLMFGAGGHVRYDIPGMIARARAGASPATVVYTDPLGSPEPLRRAAISRVAEAVGEDDPAGTSVVVVGRGSTDSETNAEHARLCRLLQEESGVDRVVPAFLKHTQPTLSEALGEARLAGATRLVVLPYFLFPGRQRGWVRTQSQSWAAANPTADVRVTDVLGPCPELAEVVVERYREGGRRARSDPGSQAYLTGLLLRGRRVVVVGGGAVATRRIPRLIKAGADVSVVAPDLLPDLHDLVDAGAIEWRARSYQPGDLEGAWYVLAATATPDVNAAVAAEADARHTFCVRSDDAPAGSAWTPVTGDHDGVTVAAIARRDPRRSQRIRNRILRLLSEENL